MIKIPEEKIVKAKFTEGWNMSLFGKPKLSIVCGNCSGQFSTRQYINLYEKGRHTDSVACCQFCGYWNRLGLKYE